MDQLKIGRFIKSLRQEKGLTQEQLAETLGVTNRSVSRWENGNNLPDMSVLLELAEYFDVDVGEVLDGERKDGNMDKKMEETILKVADYEQLLNTNLMRGIRKVLILALMAGAVWPVFTVTGLVHHPVGGAMADAANGAVFGLVALGVALTSSRYMSFAVRTKRRIVAKMLGREGNKE